MAQLSLVYDEMLTSQADGVSRVAVGMGGNVGKIYNNCCNMR